MELNGQKHPHLLQLLVVGWLTLAVAFPTFAATTVNTTTKTTPSTCYVFSKELGVGSSGDAVKKLHDLLLKEEFSKNVGGNQYTEETAAAIVQFQQKYNVTPSGYVGKTTLVALNNLCKSLVVPQPPVATGVQATASLISKNISKTTETSNSISTSTLTATFQVKIKTGDKGVILNSSSFPFAVYKNGTLFSADSFSPIVSSPLPFGASLSTEEGKSWLVPANKEVVQNVTFVMKSRSKTGSSLTSGLYAVELLGIRWTTADGLQIQSIAGDSSWRTSAITLP